MRAMHRSQCIEMCTGGLGCKAPHWSGQVGLLQGVEQWGSAALLHWSNECGTHCGGADTHTRHMHTHSHTTQSFTYTQDTVTHTRMPVPAVRHSPPVSLSF